MPCFVVVDGGPFTTGGGMRHRFSFGTLFPCLLLGLLTLSACADGDEDAAAEASGEPSPADVNAHRDTSDDPGAPREVPFDWRPQVEEFSCLKEWEAVRGLFLTNAFGHLEEALETAEQGFERPLPAGTIVQLVPFEAMVKLAPGASPETDDWEFVLLENSRRGTEIIARGGAEVSNEAGSCMGCHVGARDRDMICEQTGRCDAAALPRSAVDILVAGDPRCR